MYIHSHSTLRDGGTAVFTTSRGIISLDRRSITETRGRLYWGYPGGGLLLDGKCEEELIPVLLEYLGEIKKIIDDIESPFLVRQ